MSEEKQRNFALFIDGDNTACQNIKIVIDIVKQRGKILIKRVYGDFSQENMKNWYKYSLEHSLEPIQVWRIKGKQSSDLKITADCIELMINKHNIDNYVLVTGDGDFITLVNKLKMNDKYVIGFSQSKKSTSEYLPNSCDEFVFIDMVINSSKKIESNHQYIENTNMTVDKVDTMEEETIIEDNSNMDNIKEIIKAFMIEYESDLIGISTLKERLLELNPTFSELNYGYNKFGQLMNSIPGIEIQRKDHTLYAKLSDK